jgi:two-component system phosphate regulon response regulator PhoB
MPDGSAEQSVLVVDDEEDLRNLLAFNLKEAGFRVDVCGTGEDGLTMLEQTQPSVVVLDLMLPGISGTEVCRRLRATPIIANTGVLMLTARGDEYDRVLGFEVGADDYVVKPFSVRELVFRVKALATRADERKIARSARDTGTRHRWEGLEIDPTRHIVTMDGEELSLRPLEYKLLATFLTHPGKVYSRSDLLTEVWGISQDTNTRTVDTHVRRLRERLGRYSEAIETVHGFGYRLREQPK